ncbi:lysostaphin resistance A-like protein [Actibacterium sp. D379-3]
MSDHLLAQRPFTRRTRLWAEFVGFYVAAPLIMAMVLPAQWMLPMLIAITAVGLALLKVTEGFHLRELVWNRAAMDWRFVALFTMVTLLVVAAVVLGTRPGAFLVLIRQQPVLLALIFILYPVLSALPQEVVYRTLFFRRYGPLLPRVELAIVLNAALFSLAHLMYWNWIVAGMTFFGGLVFAWAYEMRRSFAMAVLLHSIGGWIIFALGLGVYFYSGNVVRPF